MFVKCDVCLRDNEKHFQYPLEIVYVRHLSPVTSKVFNKKFWEGLIIPNVFKHFTALARTVKVLSSVLHFGTFVRYRYVIRYLYCHSAHMSSSEISIEDMQAHSWPNFVHSFNTSSLNGSLVMAIKLAGK